MMMKIELFFDMRFSTHFFNAQAYAFAQKLQLKKIHPVTTLLLRADTVDNKIISLLHKLSTKHFWPFKYIYLQMAVTHNIYISSSLKMVSPSNEGGGQQRFLLCSLAVLS